MHYISGKEFNMSYKNRLQKGLMWFLTVLVTSNIYLSPALAQSGSYGNWHMGRWMTGGWGVAWFGMLFNLLFWGSIIAGLLLLVRWLIQTTSDKDISRVSIGSNAMEILKQRYDRGEINFDKFESMKKDLLQ